MCSLEVGVLLLEELVGNAIDPPVGFVAMAFIREDSNIAGNEEGNTR